MQICFILVEPVLAENVGAAARALKTMGFDQLRVVNTDLHLQPKAQWVAHGSGDILESASCYGSLADAIEDLDLVIGTSAKVRSQKRYNYTPAELRPLIVNKGEAVARVGIVFGREDRGLSNEELELCDLLTSIPLAQSYPSLNLGQAVMLYAWELSSLPKQHSTPDERPSLDNQLRVLRGKVEQLLERVSSDSQLRHWAKERLGVLSEKDIHFLYMLHRDIERQLKD